MTRGAMSSELQASPTGYAAAAAANPPPPPILPTPIAGSGSIVDNLLATLGTAANLGVPTDYVDAQTGHADRAAKTAEAEAKFPANEEDSSAQLATLPQLAAGIAGALAGAFGGALQPLSQAPQQAAQAGEQAMQAAMGSLQQAGGGFPDPDAVPDDVFDGGGKSGEITGASDGFGAGDSVVTMPSAVLGPPAIPSAATVPASSSLPTVTPKPPEAPTAPKLATGAMPMMPPGGMPAPNATPGESKSDTKRVVVPAVRNGAPVQGRITTAPPDVTKRLTGKPIATRHES